MTSKPIKLNIAFLVQGILYRWRLILIPLILLPLATVFFKDKVPKKYKASAKIFVQNSLEVNPFFEDMQVDWTVQSRLPLIKSVINSRTTLEKVLRETKELNDTDTEEKVDGLVSDLRSRIEIYSMGGGLVRIGVVGGSPDNIYHSLESLTQIFIDTMLRPQKQSLEEAQSFLNNQLLTTRKDLSEMEDKIQTFRQENVEELPEVFQVNMNSYLSTQQALLESKTELRAAKRRKSNLEARLRVFNPVARELEGKLVQERARLGELRSIYKDDHPEVLACQERIAKLSKERKKANIKPGKFDLAELESAARMRFGISGTNTGAMGGVTNQATDLITSDLLDYKAVAAEIAALKGATSALQTQSEKTLESTKSFAKTQRVLTELMRDYEVIQNKYTVLLERSEDAKIKRALAMSEQQNQVWMIEEPRLPTTPTGVPQNLFVIISVFVGLIIGVSIAAALELLDRSVRRSEDIEQVCNIKSFGILPSIKNS